MLSSLKSKETKTNNPRIPIEKTERFIFLNLEQILKLQFKFNSKQKPYKFLG